MKIPINQHIHGCIIDHIDVEDYGVLRIWGWSTDVEIYRDLIQIEQGNAIRLPDHFYQQPRADVINDGRTHNLLCGFCVEFIDNFGFEPILLICSKPFYKLDESFSNLLNYKKPAYKELLTTDRVYHRKDIYGEGEPLDEHSDTILSIAERLIPPILDFGCGNGSLVAALREKGIEAYGIELERAPIIASLKEEAKDYITLYDGKSAPDFKENQFGSIVSSEVLEHIIDYEEALGNIQKWAKYSFFITVPDMSSIPIGSNDQMVPWHLLESTHVNFFTYNSLRKTLLKFFNEVTMLRISPGEFNQTFMPGSLGAIAEK